MVKVTKKWIMENRTVKGAWTKAQIHALGMTWPPRKGWIGEIVGKMITDENARLFEASKTTKAGSTKTNGVEITIESALNIVINGINKLPPEKIFLLELAIKGVNK